MGSKKFSFDGEDAKVIGMMFLVALAGAAITWLQEIETKIEWGFLTPLVSALIVMAIGALRQFIKDNTIAKIIIVLLALSPVAAFAGGHFLIGGPDEEPAAYVPMTSTCNCENSCVCTEVKETCDCKEAELTYVSTTKPQDPGRSRQILMFTQENCIPCGRWEHTQKVAMLNAGWTFGDETNWNTHVRIIDDPKVADLYKIESFPTFICMENGLIVKRFDGYTTATELKEVYNVQRTYYDSGKDPSKSGTETSSGSRLDNLATNHHRDHNFNDRQLQQPATSNGTASQPQLNYRTYCNSQGCYTSVPGVRTYVTRQQSTSNSGYRSFNVLRTFRRGTGCVSCRN